MKYLTCLLAFALAVSPGFATVDHAYVCNQLSNSVTIIDVVVGTTQAIFGFNHPRTVHLNPEGTLAFIGCDDNTLRVVDTSSELVLPIIVNVSHPVATAVSPNAHFIYVASNDDTVSVVDTSTYTVVAAITGFDILQDIKVTPDGKFAYVTNAGNNTVSVIDTSNNTIVETITGFHKPVGITMSIDGTFAYITETSHNTVSVIDLATNTISKIIYGFNFPSYAAASPNKNFVYVANTGSDTVSVIRTDDNFSVYEIPIPTPKSMAVSADGFFLYVGSTTTVYKVDLITYTIVAAIPGFSNPSNIELSHNNAPAFTVNACLDDTDPMNLKSITTWGGVNGTPTQYRIFRDAGLGHLVATVPSGTLHYTESNLLAEQTYSYYVIADYPSGFSSTIGSVRVTPQRLCQK